MTDWRMPNALAAEALVVGLGINGLGVVRALAPYGVSVAVLTDDFSCPSAHSRFGRKIACTQLSGQPLLDALSRYTPRTQTKPVLLLTQELSVRTVAENLEAVRRQFAVAMPSADTVHALMNKDAFLPIAQQAGLLMPKTATVRNAEGIEQIAMLRPPLIVKPSIHSPAYMAKFKKAYVLATHDEAAALIDEMLAVHGEIIVQEWIEGEDQEIYFCLQYHAAPGQVLASFSGRKTASWPPRTGGTAGCVPAAEEHAVLHDMTTRFFAGAGFLGLGSVEYKRDSRDGAFYMIEPTACRTDYQSEIAVLNGVNIPLMAFCHAAGLPLPIMQPMRRYGWVDEGAIFSGAKPPWRGRFDDGVRWRGVGALTRLRDPMPALHFYGAKVLRKIAGLRRA